MSPLLAMLMHPT